MKKFMKAFVGVITRLALIAIVIVGTMGINEFFGDTGVIVLLCVVSGAWIVLGIFDDDVEANDLRQRLVDAETENKVLSSRLSESNVSLMTMTECYNQACERVNSFKLSRDDYRRRYEEAQKREALLHKTLREKRGQVSYWRSKYEQSSHLKTARK